jgi:hypothetical protein
MNKRSSARRPSTQRASQRTTWLTVACLAALCVLAAVPATGESTDCHPAGSCKHAHGVLSALLDSSSEEIRLHAALGLLENGCGSSSVGITGAQPGCLEPGNAQYESCKANCRKNSPDVPECFDGCVDVLGAVLTRCPEGRDFVADNQRQNRSDCYDCLQDCSDAYYECNEDCRNAEPWDPDCYDRCERDCDSQCTPPC